MIRFWKNPFGGTKKRLLLITRLNLETFFELLVPNSLEMIE